MNCKENRSIFNLFKIFSCDSCDSFYKDEEFVIGKRKVSIYYSENKCKYINFVKEDENIYFNPKIKLFLKDAIINNDNLFKEQRP